MIRVAITGNIASGKSEVQKIIEAEGHSVLDADKVGHEVLMSEEVKAAFADYDVFTEKGNISREKLGKLVFESPALKTKLEDISHPKILAQILDFFEDCKDKKFAFVAVPLLYEAKMEDLFDKVLLVYTTDTIRKQRLIERNGYSDEYADLRMSCQISQDIKKQKADYLIVNDKSKKDLVLEVYKFLDLF